MNDIIYAEDYNNLVDALNPYLGIGTGVIGLGQPTLPTITSGSLIHAIEWNNLRDKMETLFYHQVYDNSGVPARKVVGDVINADRSDYSQAIQTINSRYGATVQYDRDISVPYPLSTNWTTSAFREVSITFATPDAARYFFNAGGQILVNFNNSVLTGSAKSDAWYAFLTRKIEQADLTYLGFARAGTGGHINAYETGKSYYDLTTSYQTFLDINDDDPSSDYINNRVQIKYKSNGINLGGHGDHGNIIYIQMIAVDGSTEAQPVTGTLNMNVIVRPPHTTFLNRTWGTFIQTQITNSQS
jgi:hypothetical protein